MHEIALRTRQHRSGNSMSVRLPGVAAYPDPKQELEVIVRGDERVLRPVKPLEAVADHWPKAQWTIDELVAWQEARPPSRITDNALVRGEGRRNPWD